MNNGLMQTIMQALMGKNPNGYDTGGGLPSGSAGREGSPMRYGADLRALKELYTQAVASGDEAKAEEIMAIIREMTGAQKPIAPPQPGTI